MSSLRNELKRLSTSSAVYLVPNLFLRGLTFLLTPIYARAMSPGDYGTLGVATTIGGVASLALSLSLHGSITRLHFEYKDDPTRQRTFYGTLLGFMLVFPAALTAILHLLGTAGHLDVFATVRYEPHLRIVLFTAFAQSFLPIPTAMYMVREQPVRVGVLNMVAALTQLGLTLLYVVGMHEGLLGALRAALHASIITAVVALVVMAANASLTFSVDVLKQALRFSVPLVPHALAAWALSISDRLVLERFVTRDDLGRYSIGYLFAFAVGLFAQSITTPLGPAANRQLKEDPQSPNVPPLGTYAFVAIAAAAMCAACFAREAIAILAPPIYRGAEQVVPWVVLGSVFQGCYLILSTGTWFSMKTRLIPLVTAAGAIANVVINIIAVPRYGILAAAVATAMAYGVMAILHAMVAHSLFPIRWELKRWATIALISFVAYGVCASLSITPVAIALKALTVLVALVAMVLASGLRRLRRQPRDPHAETAEDDELAATDPGEA